jgi:hypothetical protein
MSKVPGSVLTALVADAVHLKAEYVSVEYKAGFEEVFASSGGVGQCIARFPSSGPDAAMLRTELDEATRRKRRVAIGSAIYEVHATTYDSFGETGFRVTLKRL